MPDIYLLTESNDFFGQTRKAWVPLNISKLVNELENFGYLVNKRTFDHIVNSDESIKNAVILYAFSQKENVRRYILDTMHFLQTDNFIVPSIDLLLCHEDKGYQELFKKQRGFTSLPALYFSSIDELNDQEFDFPAVLKAVDGSNGKQVFLVNDKNDLEKILTKKFTQIRFKDRLDFWRRLYFRKKKFEDYPEYNDRTDALQWRRYITNHKNFVLQKFVPNLSYDYRVLVLGEKYFVMKRHTRENDFKASGTKRFNFDFEPNPKMLNFAREIYQKAETPFLSIDICESNDEYFLVEFQALHFGTAVHKKSQGFWSYTDSGWAFILEKYDFEHDLADSFIKFIKANGF